MISQKLFPEERRDKAPLRPDLMRVVAGFGAVCGELICYFCELIRKNQVVAEKLV
ncbi:hypothetical protein HMPREF0201_00322 [Cedecea davisae DSM 4568]|uniref:Uncharacterized protein n=1 Tax=Cedecea davisae DSM 4568 TaxID=566551 RepID=S3J7I8_9ENTR|nr:hypothetical protein HMPREF0201_00322 [Cedecea davisae DSM 4568]